MAGVDWRLTRRWIKLRHLKPAGVIEPMRAWTAEMRGQQSRLGYLLAVVALCLQVAVPVLLAPQISAATQDDFAAFLRLHALCLGGDAAQPRPEPPAQDRSDRTSHHV